jgi:phosphoglucomutase
MGDLKILLTGASGQLGARLAAACVMRGWEVCALSRADLDICDAAAVLRCFRAFSPDVVFNTAAFTAVDAAEREVDLAFSVNRDGAGVVAACCEELGVQLVHISTDYVFSGAGALDEGARARPYSVTDSTSPVGVYARSKFAGEQAVLAACPSSSVVRTGWLYDFSGRNFFTTMLRLASDRQVIPVVADQVGCPTYVGVFAEDLLDWAALGAGRAGAGSGEISGLHHYGHGGQASWFAFASRILASARPDVQVKPITTAEFPTAAERPAWSKLDERPFFAALGRAPISWEAALDRCLVEATAERWTRAPFDAETVAEVRALLAAGDKEPLIEQFHCGLAFGTGGMRGRMGVGTNRVNRYTIAMATQGLAAYLREHAAAGARGVAIAYDSRNRSPEFAQVAAEVLAGNGIEAHVFGALRPTPELSFAVRRLGCAAGIVITASHNPKEYNGYKVYWADGAQVVPPHDEGIIACVRNVQDIEDVRFESNSPRIHTIDAAQDTAYRQLLINQRLSADLIKNGSDMPIVFSALHGAGGVSVPPALKACGFRNVGEVAEQAAPDGDFPTVKSPNPEEASALELALKQAKTSGAQLVLATDPDSDRVGAAAPDAAGAFQLLNGNQTGALLVHYVLEQRAKSGDLLPGDYVARTVVTTRLIEDIARHFEVDVALTLTGFKWIAAAIAQRESVRQPGVNGGRYLVGGEESYGYLIGEAVRDKDAASSAVMLAEIADLEWKRGRTLWDRLDDIHRQFGHYQEALVSIVREGRTGQAEIAEIMDGLRNNPPATLGGEAVTNVTDLLKDNAALGLPASNVIQLETETGALITARPSGTEPKIKYYFSVRNAPSQGRAGLSEQIARFKAELA